MLTSQTGRGDQCHGLGVLPALQERIHYNLPRLELQELPARNKDMFMLKIRAGEASHPYSYLEEQTVEKLCQDLDVTIRQEEEETKTKENAIHPAGPRRDQSIHED